MKDNFVNWLSQISKAKPTRNNMLPRKHDQVLVSSQDDENIWDDLVASDPNFPVHNGEGILSSVCAPIRVILIMTHLEHDIDPEAKL